MSYNEFLKKIDKGRIDPVYLFYSEERLLADDLILKVVDKTIATDLGGFNYNVFDGGKIDLGNIIAIAQSFPVFSAWRVILIRDINLIPAEGLSLIIKYIKAPSPTTCLILVANKPDLRKKFFQDVKGILDPIQIRRPSGVHLLSWVRSKAKDRGLTITDDAASFIIERSGDDLQGILNEIEKLSIYLEGNKAVRLEDLKQMIYGEEAPSVFELTGSIGEKNISASLRLLSRLLGAGEPPLVILSMIIRQFRIIWRIVEAKEARRSISDLLDEIGIPKGFQGRLIKQSERFTRKELSNTFSLFLKTDLDLKSSRISPRIILEDLILKLCAPLQVANEKAQAKA